MTIDEMTLDEMTATAQLQIQEIDDKCRRAIDDLRINRVIMVECNATAGDLMVEYFTGTPLEQSEMDRVEAAIRKLFGEREVEVHHCLDPEIDD